MIYWTTHLIPFRYTEATLVRNPVFNPFWLSGSESNIYIRPYTVSQVALLLLIVLILFFLYQSFRQRPDRERVDTLWIMQAVAWGGVAIFVTLISGSVDSPLVASLYYIRNLSALLLYHAFARFLYALPPVQGFGFRREEWYFSRIMLLLAGLELLYSAARIGIFWQTGDTHQRPLVLEMPLMLVGLWALLLLLRKLWSAEKSGTAGPGETLRRILSVPLTNVGTLYRWFLLIIASLIGLNLLYVTFQHSHVPVWATLVSDLLVMSSTVTLAFIYLRYHHVPVPLIVRVIGAGLVIFLGLVSSLGWLLTMTALNFQGPGIPIADVIGSQMRPLFLSPPHFPELASSISHLLWTVIWFQTAGSLAFILSFSYYYRGTLAVALQKITAGFGQVETGNLAYRIPSLPWNDEFGQIANSFNQMAQALEKTSQDVYGYQNHLKELVDQRTTELGQEIEARKNLELHQSIQAERARIARDSHDGLLQTLLGVRIRLNRGKRLSQMAPSRIQSEMLDLAGEVGLAAQELRNLINDLNADILTEGLPTALDRIIKRQQRSFGIPIRAQIGYQPGLLTPAQELNVLRIVQEAISNSCRHSNASEIGVAMQCESQAGCGAKIELEIADNGDGFQTTAVEGAGWGLKNMQSRSQQLGAYFHIHSRPGEGTFVRLTMESRQKRTDD